MRPVVKDELCQFLLERVVSTRTNYTIKLIVVCVKNVNDIDKLHFAPTII